MTRLITLALGALVIGCAHQTVPPPAEPRAEYRIGREDVITVEVWKDPALSAKVPVRPDGRISLPMIGEVEAAGRTANEIQQEVAERLRPVVEKPVVSVIVSEINATRFYVLGEVAHPGAFPVRGRVTLVQALALAGGPTEFANPRRVVLIRNGSDGKEKRYQINARAVLAGNAPPVELAPGDTVYVP